MESRVLVSCAAGILLGVLIIVVPLQVLSNGTEITGDQLASYLAECGFCFGGSPLGLTISVGVIVVLGLVFATSAFLLIKHHLLTPK